MTRAVAAGAVVLAGVAAALAVGQLPAIGATHDTRSATPASADQSLICPGAAVAVGAAGTGAASFSATGTPVRTSGTVGGAQVRTTPLRHGNVHGGTVPRLLTAPAAAADGRAGAVAAAQVETVSGGDASGLAAIGCTPSAGDVWLAAGATTTGRTTVLVLTNPSSADADVAVQVWNEDGRVAPTGSGTVTVPGRTRRAVSLAGIAPSSGGTVVHVGSTGSRIGAVLEQRTVRGLESGGVDLVGATAAPARAQVVPGVRISDATAVAAAQHEDDYADLVPVVRVLLPGTRASDVAIRVRPDSGGPAIALGRRVAAGVVTDFPVAGLGDGTYTVSIAADQPLVTGVRTSVVGDAHGSTVPKEAPSTRAGQGDASAAPGTDAGLVGGDAPADPASSPTAAPSTGAPTSTARGVDLAWFAAAQQLGDVAAVAVTDAPSPLLTISGTGAARTVRLSGPVDQTVQVPASGSITVPVAPGVVVLRGASGLVAGVSYAGPGAVAGYPVRPADQRAHAVRISR